MGSACRFFYRANIIKYYNILFDTDVVRGEDLLFNLKFFCKAESVITYNKALYHYYVKKEGAMYKKFTDMDKLLTDKLGTLRVRDSIRNEIMNKYNIDILDWYMGSNAISIIGLAVNLAGSNLPLRKQCSLLTKYIETGSVKESRNMVLRMKIPMKWRIPLTLSVKWVRPILLILLGILQKTGFSNFKILS